MRSGGTIPRTSVQAEAGSINNDLLAAVSQRYIARQIRADIAAMVVRYTDHGGCRCRQRRDQHCQSKCKRRVGPLKREAVQAHQHRIRGGTWSTPARTLVPVKDRAWFFVCRDRLEVELEVHAGADKIFGQADGDGNCRTVWRHAIRTRRDHAGGGRAVKAAVAEVDEEIFDLGCPVIGKSPFDTGASSPAGLGMGGINAIKGCFHIGEGATRSAVEQNAIEGKTEAAARRRQPIITRLAIAAEVANTGGRAVGASNGKLL
jgi:hypothetical protein